MNTTMNTGAASLSDDELALIREEAATITDDWAERQLIDPTRKETDAKFVREILRLCATTLQADAAIAAGGAQEPIGHADVCPGSDGGFTMAVFKASDVPEGSPLYAAPLPRVAAAVGLTDGQREAIMEQAQVFASAWSLVGGPFDYGDALETAEQEKENLRALLAASNGEQA